MMELSKLDSYSEGVRIGKGYTTKHTAWLVDKNILFENITLIVVTWEVLYRKGELGSLRKWKMLYGMVEHW